MTPDFEQMLTGGHPNSLGRTDEVAQIVLADPTLIDAFFVTYNSGDAVVRMRVSSALKRITIGDPTLVLNNMDRLLGDVAALDQPSAQWSLAQIFGQLAPDMTATQKRQAQAILKRNLEVQTDWIVLNFTMETLTDWALTDPELAQWLRPQLVRHAKDARKSVRARALKFQTKLMA